MSEFSVILYEPESIIKMLLSRLFRRHGADVLEAKDTEELVRLLHDGKSGNKESHAESIQGKKVVVLGEPPPHREEHEIVHSLPDSFPGYSYILLAGGTVYSDTAGDSQFDGVVHKPFRFGELLELIASLN